MKTIRYIFIALIIIFVSCEESIFDKQPLDKISGADVWKDQAMIRAVVTGFYPRLSNTQFPDYYGPSWHTYGDEATASSGNSCSVTTGGASRTNDNLAYWDYTFIRDLNIFLQKIGDAPINEVLKKQMEGEVRTIRAYTYLEMQKRYGGVPLVDVPLEPFLEPDKKYTARSKEEEIADFIDSELTLAISLLTETPTKGQINKWTAYAIKARANLWAASIAKFGSVQINGLVGIPDSRANEFYTKASEAAQEVIGSGKYSLYNKLADKSENYRTLFIDDNNNSEVIFQRVYDGVNFGHSWESRNAPLTFSDGMGNGLNPFIEFILGFENIDGTPDQPVFGPDNLYENGFAPFIKKDPRLHATVFFQGDPWGGGIINTYEGLDPSTLPDPGSILSSPGGYYQGTPTIGDNSRVIAQSGFGARTGFVSKKHTVNEIHVVRGNSTTDWKIIRLAEMYLIKAEAEFEKGINLTAAAEALNATRLRAGISLVDQNTITRELVRTERKSEMSLETNRYWDLRRWRIAENVLNGAEFKGLRIILHFKTGKYYFLPLNMAEGFSRAFRHEHYYNPITDSRINNNPDLIENPNY